MRVKLILLIMVAMSLSFASGETTFFEGDGEEFFIMDGENNVDASSVYCGNTICDVGESCDNCMRDCGSCSGGSGRVIANQGDEAGEPSGLDSRVIGTPGEIPLCAECNTSTLVAVGVAWSVLALIAGAMGIYFLRRRRKR